MYIRMCINDACAVGRPRAHQLVAGIIGEAHGSAAVDGRDPDRILALRRNLPHRQPAAIRGKRGFPKPAAGSRGKGGLSKYGAFGAIAFVQPYLVFSVRGSLVNKAFALCSPERHARRPLRTDPRAKGSVFQRCAHNPIFAGLFQEQNPLAIGRDGRERFVDQPASNRVALAARGVERRENSRIAAQGGSEKK